MANVVRNVSLNQRFAIGSRLDFPNRNIYGVTGHPKVVWRCR